MLKVYVVVENQLDFRAIVLLQAPSGDYFTINFSRVFIMYLVEIDIKETKEPGYNEV